MSPKEEWQRRPGLESPAGALESDQPGPTEPTFDLNRWFWQPIRHRWPLIAGITIAAVLLTLAWQAYSTPKYTARAVVYATNQQADGLARQLGSLGGVAALAGASLGKTEQVSEFEKFRFMLTSERLGDYHARERDMLPIVFWKSWDKDRKDWKRPTGTLQALKDAFWPMFGLEPWQPPDGRSLAKVYSKRLAARAPAESGLLRVSYEDTDPDRAKFILQSAIEDANEIVRQDAAQRAAAKAEYLRSQLAVAQVAEYRINLAMLLATEEQTLMLTSTKLPYAAELVQPYTVSRDPTSQKPVTYGIIALVAGLSIGVFIALMLGPVRPRA